MTKRVDDLASKYLHRNKKELIAGPFGYLDPVLGLYRGFRF